MLQFVKGDLINIVAEQGEWLTGEINGRHLSKAKISAWRLLDVFSHCSCLGSHLCVIMMNAVLHCKDIHKQPTPCAERKDLLLRLAKPIQGKRNLAPDPQRRCPRQVQEVDHGIVEDERNVDGHGRKRKHHVEDPLKYERVNYEDQSHRYENPPCLPVRLVP